MLSKIKEIRKALENNMPQCALALVLTLPDICGQVEYPNEAGVGKRYMNWLEKYISADAFNANYDGALTTFNDGEDPKFPKIDSNAIYKLRCEFLHSGDVEIENDNKVSRDNYLDEFIFTEIGAMDLKNEKGFGARGGYISYIEKNDMDSVIRTYQMDPKYLCEVICDAVEKYYDSSTDKAVFDEHSVKFMS